MINNLDINDFLKNYWQKKPLLIRAAFPNYQTPISPDELAGLACEDFVESRIIYEDDSHDLAAKWNLENGPFEESRFSTLPESHWTLLIQGLNKISPEFDDLLHQFNFIPSWRVDDLMASYAAQDGSVGPHTDNYDVFLLQASGRRKWMISEKAVTADNIEKDIPVKIIKNFKAESEWILEAGDMLYLPENVAHYGIGMDNCMTFSIGFRSPSHADLLTGYVDDHITELTDNLRFQDPQLTTDQKPGEISSAAIDKVQEILLSQFKDKSKVADWFGRYITDYLNDFEDHEENNLSSIEFLDTFKHRNFLRRVSSVRANYLINETGAITLFINGAEYNIKHDIDEIVKIFCNQHLYTYQDIKQILDNKNSLEFLSEIYNNGCLEFSDE